jgi:hypothetical protein
MGGHRVFLSQRAPTDRTTTLMILSPDLLHQLQGACNAGLRYNTPDIAGRLLPTGNDREHFRKWKRGNDLPESERIQREIRGTIEPTERMLPRAIKPEIVKSGVTPIGRPCRDNAQRAVSAFSLVAILVVATIHFV